MFTGILHLIQLKSTSVCLLRKTKKISFLILQSITKVILSLMMASSLTGAQKMFSTLNVFCKIGDISSRACANLHVCEVVCLYECVSVFGINNL